MLQRTQEHLEAKDISSCPFPNQSLSNGSLLATRKGRHQTVSYTYINPRVQGMSDSTISKLIPTKYESLSMFRNAWESDGSINSGNLISGDTGHSSTPVRKAGNRCLE